MAKHKDLQNEPEGVLGKAPKDFPEERLFLYGLIRATKPERVIEIGVSAGCSAVVICRAMKENGSGLYVGVDNWSCKHGGRAKSQDLPRENIIKDGTPEKFFELISMESQEFLKQQKNDSADIVIVDGNHSFKYATRDTKEAMRIARWFTMTHDACNIEDVTKACAAISKHGFWVPSSRGYWIYDVTGK